MKIDLEVQHLCTEYLRGIPYYILNLAENLVRRENNEYSISFFDYKGERGNRRYIQKYVDEALLEKLSIHECQDLSYRTIMDSNVNGDASEYDEKSYQEYMSSDADITHFTQSLYIPLNIRGKAIVTVHDVIPLLPTARKYCLENSIKAFKNAMRYLEENEDIEIISDSLATKKDIVKYTSISEDRIHVVPLAYDKAIHYPEKNEEILKKYNIDGDYILYLGVMDSRKGILEILEAFDMLKETYTNLKLVLAGQIHTIPFENGELLGDIIKRQKNIDDIILTGFVSNDEKRALLSSAMCFMFPSEYEGFGLPVLEAMACGAPVVTTDVSSIPEVGGDAAKYITPGNAKELANAVKELLDSKELRDTCIQNGFKQVEKFSWDKTAELTEEVYLKVYSR